MSLPTVFLFFDCFPNYFNCMDCWSLFRLFLAFKNNNMCGVHIHFITLPIHLSWQQDCHHQQASQHFNNCTSNQDIGISAGNFFWGHSIIFLVSSIWQMLQTKLQCSKKKIECPIKTTKCTIAALSGSIALRGSEGITSMPSG